MFDFSGAAIGLIVGLLILLLGPLGFGIALFLCLGIGAAIYSNRGPDERTKWREEMRNARLYQAASIED